MQCHQGVKAKRQNLLLVTPAPCHGRCSNEGIWRAGRRKNRKPPRHRLVAAVSSSSSTFTNSFKAPVGSTLKQHLSANGQWRIRPMRSEEAAEVAAIQAEAFHEPLPLGLLNRPLFYAFQAEVLSGLRQKVAYSPQDGFTCLVAESLSEPGSILGVVEISLQAGKPELGALQQQGLEELVYAYVACMAVRKQDRRKGVASALLKAAEIQAGRWNQNWVLLHVYMDNIHGISLYRRNGYAELFRDPGWQQVFGRRRRLLLAKGAAVTGAAGAIQSISDSVMHLFQQGQEGAWEQS